MVAASNLPQLYPARPTLEVDGQANADLSEQLRSLVIEEDSNGLYRAEMTLSNWSNGSSGADFTFFDRQVIDFGKDIAVKMAAGDNEDTVFRGRVASMEGRYIQGKPSELTVLLEDRLQDLRMTRRTRTFDQVSESDLVNTIAGEHGLTPDV